MQSAIDCQFGSSDWNLCESIEVKLIFWSKTCCNKLFNVWFQLTTYSCVTESLTSRHLAIIYCTYIWKHFDIHSMSDRLVTVSDVTEESYERRLIKHIWHYISETYATNCMLHDIIWWLSRHRQKQRHRHKEYATVLHFRQWQIIVFNGMTDGECENWSVTLALTLNETSISFLMTCITQVVEYNWYS